MALFSERQGHVAARTIVQREELDEVTRMDVWNLSYQLIDQLGEVNHSQRRALAQVLWADYLKQPLDDFDYASTVLENLKEQVLEWEWFRAFDIIEFLLSSKYFAGKDVYAGAMNRIFEEHLVGYRLIDGKIRPVDSEAEVDAIEGAQSDATGSNLAGVRHHLATSIDLLADRAKPDYPNSVKESVSAVEAMLEVLTGEAVLSKALKKLNGVGVAVHPALLTAWDKTYGWASDEDGVRHSAAAPPSVDQATAKYMLVTSSAFVSWLIESGRKAGRL